jgi:hypothetical protein
MNINSFYISCIFFGQLLWHDERVRATPAAKGPMISGIRPAPSLVVSLSRSDLVKSGVDGSA